MLCGMIYLPPFALFGARTAVEQGRINGHIADWVAVLTALRNGRLNIEKARNLPKLNSDLAAIIDAE